MDRRGFLKTSAGAGLGALGLVGSSWREAAAMVADQPAKRVGLIGCGWYGKCDLFRLIQVAPVEVVSLCDVDSQDARRGRRDRRPSGRRRRRRRGPTATTARCSSEKDLDIVLIATPDHWHALPMIAAVEAGADVYVQKPISVDVVEGQAMLAAARKHGRVVQVGTQRRSTPHLIEARDRIINDGHARQDRARRDLLLLPHADPQQPARHRPAGEPRLRDVDRPGPDAAVQPDRSTRAAGGRSWSTATASSATCASTCSTWSAGCSTWAGRSGSRSTGGILVDKDSKANITDTQTATFDFGDLNVVWQHRTWGDAPDPEYPWGGDDLRRQGHAQGQRASATTSSPAASGEPIHGDVTYELEQYPEDKTEKDLEKHVAPAIRGHMLDFLAGDRRPRQAGGRHRAGLHLHGQLHPGQHVACSSAARSPGTPRPSRVVGDDEANALLRRPYRQPWVHPEPPSA